MTALSDGLAESLGKYWRPGCFQLKKKQTLTLGLRDLAEAPCLSGLKTCYLPAGLRAPPPGWVGRICGDSVMSNS